MRSEKLMLGASLAAFAASAAAQTTVVGTNQSTVSQTGSNNSANVSNAVAGNDDNSSSVTQNGNRNSVTVEQVGDLNISRIRQLGDDNRAEHRQTGNRNSGDTDQLSHEHSSIIAQRGDDNLGAVVQNSGNRNSSTIFQGNPASGGAAGNSNTASVRQQGSDNISYVAQHANAGGTTTAAGVSVSDNFARVVQGDASRAPSDGASSGIFQSSRGNSATVLMYEGAASILGQNKSVVIQGHNNAPGLDQPGSGTVSGNRASVAIRGFGNRSEVNQNGLGNYAEVTLLRGGTSSDGNRILLFQGGRDLSAAIVGGSALASEGRGNSAVMRQDGSAHHLELWQRGFFEGASITQEGSPFSPISPYSDGSRARALTSISQRGDRSNVASTQRGDNQSEITQGLGSNNRVLVFQIDAGDFAVGSTDPAHRAFNRAGVAQYGNSQEATIRQYAINASATIYQQRGPSTTPTGHNHVVVEQGLAYYSDNPEEPPHAFFGPRADVGGANSLNLVANATQGDGTSRAFLNRARIRQDGVNLNATISQAGLAAAGAHNKIEIAQRGSDNRATAIQRAGVGPSGTDAPPSGQSGDEFHFAGGRRSAEILILQKNSGNSAVVEQRGLGQLARIEQSGARNSASILQEAGAANATAVIRQSGNDNSYAVTQTQAGQYILVSQTGDNNSVTSVVQRPGG